MYEVYYTRRFLSAAKRCKKQGRDLTLLWDTVKLLMEEGKLPDYYNPHLLHDEYAGYWECHIEDDWLLVWKQNDGKLTLVLTDTGSHEELFRKKFTVVSI